MPRSPPLPRHVWPPAALFGLPTATDAGVREGFLTAQARAAADVYDPCAVAEEEYRTEGVISEWGRLAGSPSTRSGDGGSRAVSSGAAAWDGTTDLLSAYGEDLSEGDLLPPPHTSHSSDALSLNLAALRVGAGGRGGGSIHGDGAAESPRSAAEEGVVWVDRSPRAPTVPMLFAPSSPPRLMGGSRGPFLVSAGAVGSPANSASGSCTLSPRLANAGNISNSTTTTSLSRCHLSRREEALLGAPHARLPNSGGFPQGSYGCVVPTAAAAVGGSYVAGSVTGAAGLGWRYSPRAHVGGSYSTGSTPRGAFHCPASPGGWSFYQDSVVLRGSTTAAAASCGGGGAGGGVMGAGSGPSDPLCSRSMDTYGAGRGAGGCASCPSCLLECSQSLQTSPRPATVVGTAERLEETVTDAGDGQPLRGVGLYGPNEESGSGEGEGTDTPVCLTQPRADANEEVGEAGPPLRLRTWVAPPPDAPPRDVFTRWPHRYGDAIRAGRPGARAHVDPTEDTLGLPTMTVSRYSPAPSDDSGEDWGGEADGEGACEADGEWVEEPHPTSPIVSVSPRPLWTVGGGVRVAAQRGRWPATGASRSAASSGPSSLASTAAAAGEGGDAVVPPAVTSEAPTTNAVLAEGLGEHYQHTSLASLSPLHSPSTGALVVGRVAVSVTDAGRRSHGDHCAVHHARYHSCGARVSLSLPERFEYTAVQGRLSSSSLQE